MSEDRKISWVELYSVKSASKLDRVFRPGKAGAGFHRRVCPEHANQPVNKLANSARRRLTIVWRVSSSPPLCKFTEQLMCHAHEVHNWLIVSIFMPENKQKIVWFRQN
jgi:hypothetical protein